jgi:hypothetical protein
MKGIAPDETWVVNEKPEPGAYSTDQGNIQAFPRWNFQLMRDRQRLPRLPQFSWSVCYSNHGQCGKPYTRVH